MVGAQTNLHPPPPTRHTGTIAAQGPHSTPWCHYTHNRIHWTPDRITLRYQCELAVCLSVCVFLSVLFPLNPSVQFLPLFFSFQDVGIKKWSQKVLPSIPLFVVVEALIRQGLFLFFPKKICSIFFSAAWSTACLSPTKNLKSWLICDREGICSGDTISMWIAKYSGKIVLWRKQMPRKWCFFKIPNVSVHNVIWYSFEDSPPFKHFDFETLICWFFVVAGLLPILCDFPGKQSNQVYWRINSIPTSKQNPNAFDYLVSWATSAHHPTGHLTHLPTYTKLWSKVSIWHPSTRIIFIFLLVLLVLFKKHDECGISYALAFTNTTPCSIGFPTPTSPTAINKARGASIRGQSHIIRTKCPTNTETQYRYWPTGWSAALSQESLLHRARICTIIGEAQQ